MSCAWKVVATIACLLLTVAMPRSVALGATKTARVGEAVEFQAACREGSEYVYYVFDWGDGNLGPTARGAPKFPARLSHRFDRPGEYQVAWTAVSMSGRRFSGETIKVTVQGSPLSISQKVTPSGRLAHPVAGSGEPALETAPQSSPNHTAWLGQKYDRLYCFDEVSLLPAEGMEFPQYFAVQYSMDGGRAWQEIPSASFVHFPEPRGKRVCIPLRGVVANALRVASHRPPPRSRGYGLKLGALEAYGSAELLFQCDGGPKYTAVLNNFWLVYGSAENEVHQLFHSWWPTDRPDSGGMMGIASTVWSHWNSLKISWTDTKYKSYYETMLNALPLDDEGRIGVAVGSFHHLGHSRHYICQPTFVSAVTHYYLSHRDPAILHRKDAASGLTLLEKVRRVMRYQLTAMRGETGLLVVTDPDNDGTVRGKSDNYWDAWRFGYQSAYENILFYDSLLKMAMLEESLGDNRAAGDYRRLAEKTRQEFNRVFWDDVKGRYIGTIDRLGNRHDYGFTFLNLEAIAYGLVPADRAGRILAWLDGQRVVAGDTSTGADIYHFKIAPRANTLAAEAVQPTWWDNWTMEVGKGRQGEYGTQIQNGGAILYVSYYDLMARLKAAGIAAAMKRLDTIVEEFGKDQLRRQPGNRFGIMGTVGVLREFPESGLVPLFFLHGILGIQPVVDGLSIEPHLPDGWSTAEVTDYHYAGEVYRIRADRKAAAASLGKDDKGRTEVVIPAGASWKLKLQADGKKSIERNGP